MVPKFDASENPEYLSHLGLIRYRVVSPRQMDGQTDGITIAIARLAVPAVAVPAVARNNLCTGSLMWQGDNFLIQISLARSENLGDTLSKLS